MNKPIVIEDLPKMFRVGCQRPGCKCGDEPQTELVLTQQCHPGSGVKVVIKKDTTLLRVECNHCDRLICEVVIGSNEQITTLAT